MIAFSPKIFVSSIKYSFPEGGLLRKFDLNWRNEARGNLTKTDNLEGDQFLPNPIGHPL